MIRFALALAVAFAVSLAHAQAVDCANRIISSSAAASTALSKPALDVCSRLDGYGRTKCESYNQTLLAEYPCAGKAGAILALCAREQAQKIPAEK